MGGVGGGRRGCGGGGVGGGGRWGEGGGSSVTSPAFRTIPGLCFERNIGDISERRGGAHMGLPERLDTILK